MTRQRVFSVGHSTHEQAEFVGLLRSHHVELVCDVRRHPWSRRMPWFNQDVLARDMAQHGLAYHHLPELGGRRRPARDSPNGAWRVEGFRGYADHMTSAEFAGGLDVLEQLASERTTSIMCAEGLWWRCHRRLLSDALVLHGWEVVHIGPDGGATRHEPTPFAVIDDGHVTYPPLQASLDTG